MVPELVQQAEELGFWDPARWPLRHLCGEWDPRMVFFYAFGHVSTGFAYIGIPLVLVFTAMNLDPKKIVASLTAREHVLARVTYAAFVFVCGIGHFLEGGLAFVWPNYHAFALWHTFTACVSWWAFWVTVRFRVKIVTGL